MKNQNINNRIYKDDRSIIISLIGKTYNNDIVWEKKVFNDNVLFIANVKIKNTNKILSLDLYINEKIDYDNSLVIYFDNNYIQFIDDKSLKSLYNTIKRKLK